MLRCMVSPRQIFSKPPPVAARSPVMRKVPTLPFSSNAGMPLPRVVKPPLMSISRAEPPGLMLSAIAYKVITVPFTSDSPVPPKVSMPRCTTSFPTGWLICTPIAPSAWVVMRSNTAGPTVPV